MSFCDNDVDRNASILILKVIATASFNQLLRDGRMPNFGCDVHRRCTILLLKITVTVSFNQLRCDTV
jgi:hypothetical protein